MVARFKGEYATVAEAAELLGVAQSTIRRWIREERMPVYQLGSRRLLLKRHDLGGLIAPRDDAMEVRDWINLKDLRQLRHEPMTDEEQERGRNALQDLRILGQELYEHRNGKPYISSLRLIHEGREERTRRIMGERSVLMRPWPSNGFLSTRSVRTKHSRSSTPHSKQEKR